MKIIPYLILFVLQCSACHHTGTTVATNLQKEHSELVYNAKDFGAKGDGITDDTYAIQLALDYATDNGGGTIYFPNGLYRLATIQTPICLAQKFVGITCFISVDQGNRIKYPSSF